MERRDFIGLLSCAAAWPVVARAQKLVSVKRIAVVTPVAPTDSMNEKSDHPVFRPFFAELRRLGYIEGENLLVERRSGGGRTERYAEIALELVGLKPDVIFVTSARPLAFLREATKTIPIVAITGDPILFKIVSNVSRPEGNITGFSADASIEIHGKYLEILKELKPGLSKVGLLTPRLSWEPYVTPMREIANRIGLEILGPPIDSPVEESEYRRVITAMVQNGVEGLLVTEASENQAFRPLIVELAEKNRLIAIYPNSGFAKLGGLVAYAVDLGEIGTRAAGYVDKILHGVKPGELPYYMPTRLELIINIKTAKAMGITIPPGLLARADEVIE